MSRLARSIWVCQPGRLVSRRAAPRATRSVMTGEMMVMSGSLASRGCRIRRGSSGGSDEPCGVSGGGGPGLGRLGLGEVVVDGLHVDAAQTADEVGPELAAADELLDGAAALELEQDL